MMANQPGTARWRCAAGIPTEADRYRSEELEGPVNAPV
jgi:hypothetical protein